MSTATATTNAAIQQAAMEYARLNWKIVILHPRKKKPRDTKWQLGATDDEEKLAQYFDATPDANIGLLLGPASGVIDIEYDCDEGRRTAEAIFPECFTPTYRSSRSTHRLFRWSPDLPDVQKVMIDGLEVRIGGGGRAAQSVLPPSRHPTGANYEWVPGLSPSEVELADVPEAVIAKLANYRVGDAKISSPGTGLSVARSVLEMEEIPQGQRNELLHRFACREAARLRDIDSPQDHADLIAIVQAVNESKCSPSLPASEVKTLCESAIVFIRTERGRNAVAVGGNSLDLRIASARTEVANGQRLAERYGQDVHWVGKWEKHIVYSGKKWDVDSDRQVDAMSKEVGAKIWQQTGALLPEVDRSTGAALTSFARSTASSRGVAAMISLARSEPGIPILPDVLDAHPWLLNVDNGTIDLRTGTLRPHARADLLTKISPVAFDPTATCPLWIETLDLILFRNAAMVRFVQRLLGAALVGEVIEHILPIFWGSGSNGKNVVLETMLDVFGPDYACKMASEMLLASKGDRHPTEIADLHGKRLVIASETDDGRRLREGAIKELTGGDTLKGRHMREDFWSFKPSHSLILMTNHKPEVRGTDHAIWRRLTLLPFRQKFWDATRGESGPAELRADPLLKGKLAAEHPGILRWLVAGCLEWQRDGLGVPADVIAATAAYRGSQDVVGAFVDECCELGPQLTARASLVYGSYVLWCKNGGEQPVTQRQFGAAMTELGVERFKNNGVFYRGVRMATERTERTEPFSG